ncbi:glycoside hydrolase family 13 protein [Jatrophihabitans telluris]|uniref:Glycoside hydrolase family 13 protein n=1 Tax=Jatrophihabitans telluris TaxID=2038343 RepID=A0ABY4R149_9ACTN|nr:glycoside hydrolase family 13 protein [Jatrophihabitans telluris]UQX89643.1 glycoside hydrolase family 13 protein [Jatrophihabitans telluris]
MSDAMHDLPDANPRIAAEIADIEGGLGDEDAFAQLQGGSDWWRAAVFYQIYPKSFADGNGDGIGDLIGIRERLDYLQLLGVDALWLSPFYKSPMADGGYDVSDPTDVDPMFGNLADYDALVAAAHERGIKITIDIVPNHLSDQHIWFQQALAAAPGSPERARFIFRDGKGEDGEVPPNNWPAMFGGSAWQRVPDGQWYLHLFAPEQPDVNWENPEVSAEFERILRFWLDRGTDGFRVDVAHSMAKPAGLPDMDLTEYEGPNSQLRHDLRFDNDGLHEHLRMFRRVLDGYSNRMAVGEAWVPDDERLAMYVRPDELHLTFNFRLVEAEWSAEIFQAAIDGSLTAMTEVGAPCTWVLSNHDVVRHNSRYGGGALGAARGRAAALVQLSLPGAVYLYNGDELGLENVDLPDWALQDPTWERSGHTERGRDGERVPLPWEGTEPPFGFGASGQPWLPMPAEWAAVTVEAQLEDEDSTLSLYRHALQVRRQLPELHGATFTWQQAPENCLAYRRGPNLVVALNAGDVPVEMPPGQILLASSPVDGDKLPANTAVWLRV